MARPSLERNVKFKALVRALRIPKPYVRGLLETLWDVANECGNPVLGDASDVEAAAEWPGKRGVFFAALRDCRLIDKIHDHDGQQSGEKWVIHDYWDHAPEYVKGRMRKERQRKGKRHDPSISVTGQSRDSHGTVPQKSDTPAPAPAPNSSPLSPPATETVAQEETDPNWLAREWVFYLARAPTKPDEIGAVAKQLAELIRQGVPGKVVLEAIRGDRDKAETIWAFYNRLKSTTGGTNGNSTGTNMGSSSRVRARPGKYANIANRLGSIGAEAVGDGDTQAPAAVGPNDSGHCHATPRIDSVAGVG